MFEVVIHIDIEEREHRIQVDGSRVQAVIPDIFGQARVLRHVKELREHPAIKARQHEKERRQNAPDRNAPGNDADEGRDIGARRPDDCTNMIPYGSFQLFSATGLSLLRVKLGRIGDFRERLLADMNRK